MSKETRDAAADALMIPVDLAGGERAAVEALVDAITNHVLDELALRVRRESVGVLPSTSISITLAGGRRKKT